MGMEFSQPKTATNIHVRIQIVTPLYPPPILPLSPNTLVAPPVRTGILLGFVPHASAATKRIRRTPAASDGLQQ